jgi:hypothetical protein
MQILREGLHDGSSLFVDLQLIKDYGPVGCMQQAAIDMHPGSPLLQELLALRKTLDSDGTDHQAHC